MMKPYGCSRNAANGLNEIAMPIGPDKFKQDQRSPQELAKAILDHVLTPRDGGCPYSLSFRERLFMDYQVLHNNRILRKYGEPLVLTLKAIEEGAPPNADIKRRLSHALLVTDAYKKEAVEFRQDAIIEANEAFVDPEGKPPLSFQRKDAENIEAFTVEIINLQAIDRLMRALAHKLGVSLVEPSRRK